MAPIFDRLVSNFASRTAADQFYLSLAIRECAHSDDPKAQTVPESAVGAVIVRNNNILSASANVLPDAIKEQMLKRGYPIKPEERYQVIEHAERAAIFKGMHRGEDLNGATMYCTRFPCSDCARAILWSRIGRLVVTAGFGSEGAWLPSQRAALMMLRAGGIKVRYLKPE